MEIVMPRTRGRRKQSRLGAPPAARPDHVRYLVRLAELELIDRERRARDRHFYGPAQLGFPPGTF